MPAAAKLGARSVDDPSDDDAFDDHNRRSGREVFVLDRRAPPVEVGDVGRDDG